MSRFAVAGMLAVAALSIAGCSTKSEEPASVESPPATHGSFAECLRSHGVGSPPGPVSPAGPPEGVDPATWEQAMQACSTLAPGPGGS